MRKAPATPEQQFVRKIYLRYLKTQESSSTADDVTQALMGELDWETRLKIKTDLSKMKTVFKRYGVLLLRPLKFDKLIIGCGNAVRKRGGAFSGAMCFRSHKDADTINSDPKWDPTVVGEFDFNGKGTNSILTEANNQHFFQDQQYLEIVDESGTGLLQGFSEIGRVLKSGGLFYTFGGLTRQKILDLPKDFQILLIRGRHQQFSSDGQLLGEHLSQEAAKDAYRWRVFSESSFLSSEVHSDEVVYGFSYVIGKRKSDGTFPKVSTDGLRWLDQYED